MSFLFKFEFFVLFSYEQQCWNSVKVKKKKKIKNLIKKKKKIK